MIRTVLPQTKWLIITATLLIFSTPAVAEVILTEKIDYYPIHAIGKSEITEKLRKKSPYKSGKDYYPAYTLTDIKYEYSWGKRGGRCVVTKVKVILTLTYVYPRLAQAQSKTVQDWWDAKIKRFVVHENIHGNISKRSAHELDRKLRSLNDLDCSNAKNVIASRAKYIIRQMKREQEEYDRITQHGIKQHKYRGPR